MSMFKPYTLNIDMHIATKFEDGHPWTSIGDSSMNIYFLDNVYIAHKYWSNLSCLIVFLSIG